MTLAEAEGRVGALALGLGELAPQLPDGLGLQHLLDRVELGRVAAGGALDLAQLRLLLGGLGTGGAELVAELAELLLADELVRVPTRLFFVRKAWAAVSACWTPSRNSPRRLFSPSRARRIASERVPISVAR